MIYGLCRAVLRDPDDADDATQSTFVSAYKSLLGGGVVREPAAWLATIARNECTARAHARMREPLPLIDADLGHTQGPEAELDRKTAVEELQSAISELPDKQREAVVLRDLYGLQYTEVASALGMSVASVESLLFRARRSLRVSLKPLASGALVVPVAVRDAIAQALPGFAASGGAGAGAASGAVGVGLLAKLTSGPVALKIAAGVVAVTATGSVAVVGAEQSGKHQQTSRVAGIVAPAAGESLRTARGPLAGDDAVALVFDSKQGRGDSGGDDGAEAGSGRGRSATAAAGAGSGEHERGAGDGNRERGGSTSARSGGGDDGTETEAHAGHGDGKPSAARSSDGGRSDDGKASEGRSTPARAEASHSGPSSDDPTSKGEGSADAKDSGTSSGSSNAGDVSISGEGSGSEGPSAPGGEPPETP